MRHTRRSCRPPLKRAECLTYSIGIGPSVSLGKVGSDLQKPDGLVVITKDNLPEVLLRLELEEIYSIGKRMEERLNRASSTPRRAKNRLQSKITT
jgi:nucleotidyltransferase/DNA polymerase involved in DNA repair